MPHSAVEEGTLCAGLGAGVGENEPEGGRSAARSLPQIAHPQSSDESCRLGRGRITCFLEFEQLSNPQNIRKGLHGGEKHFIHIYFLSGVLLQPHSTRRAVSSADRAPTLVC